MNHSSLLERQFLRGLILLTGVLIAGTIGYILIEDLSLVNAAYMAVITVATVGFMEVEPLTSEGRIFTIALIAVGLATVWYVASLLVALVVSGQLTQHLGGHRMERRIEQLKDHYIVCGYGRTGQQTAYELRRDNREVVVIDALPESLEQAVRDGHLVVDGNATEDSVLRHAGIDRAAGLISAVASDADNVFVSLSARALRPDLPIVARANVDDAIPKLRRAGATQVVSPYSMAGRQMAQLAIRPSTVNFVETLLRGAHSEFLLEDIEIAPGAVLAGMTPEQLRLGFPGAVLLAVQRGGEALAPAPPDLQFRAGDIIAVAGGSTSLGKMAEACKSQ